MKAYKYRNGINAYDRNGNSLFKRDLESLVNNKIYAPTVSELNDPNESSVDDKTIIDFMKSRGNESYQEWAKLKERLLKVGIYSLSSDHDNELLWAYYASGHKGFAIEYNLDYLIASFTYSPVEKMCYFIDVNYSNNFPGVKGSLHFVKLLSKPDPENIIKFYLGNKSKNWKHEEESRLILEENGLIEYDFRAVTGIYFGYRMDKSEIDFIMKKMKGRGIRYYQMKLSKNYKIEAYPIPDKYYNSSTYKVNNIDYDPSLYSKDSLKENYKYHLIVKEAIEIVCTQPLVSKVLVARVNNNPTFRIEIVTSSSGIYPFKWFEFIIDEDENLILVEDLEREKRNIYKEIREMTIEN